MITASLIQSIIEKSESKKYQKFLRDIKKETGKPDWDSRADSCGVAGNTFRAYGAYVAKRGKGEEGNRPSEIYREWAEKQNKAISKLSPESISSQEDFDNWHQKLAKSLQNHWSKTEDGIQLSIAHKYKLVDLYIKWLTQHKLPEPELNDIFIQFAHCALDSQILAKINDHLDGLLPIAKPSMGCIATENAYAFCQAVIRDYCNAVGGTPLLFDYYAWQRGG